MKYGLISRHSPRLSRPLLVGFTLLSCLFSASARAQGVKPWIRTTWTVTIDVSSGNEDPTYSYDRTPGSCGNSQTAKDLYICDGDTVKWRVKSKGGKDRLRIYQDDSILNDDNDSETKRFDAADGNATKGGQTNDNVILLRPYKYSVAVYNKSTGDLFIDDPQIIVGTGQGLATELALLKNLNQTVSHLRSLMKEDSEAARNLDQLLHQIAELKKSLHLQ